MGSPRDLADGAKGGRSFYARHLGNDGMIGEVPGISAMPIEGVEPWPTVRA